ncbi:L-2-hydroxyglutarate oxidase [Pseudarthrobacter sp. P1]|uniref:L-2-hydroxyglutarate oxidase n=1 Tax=Pseudarthrobacter sp. P1 TaxID=3418418 RepID=UPI003CE85B68
MPVQRCAVVGGGIIGTAVARELMNRIPGATTTIFEKEDGLAAHQTGHNSGVVHAGLYYEPGGLKATLCRRGVELLKDFCAAKGLPYEECGKVVVAQNASELERLHAIFARAVANGFPGVRMLTAAQLQEVEPAARGIAALHSPYTAIVDYSAVTRALAADVLAGGGRILFGAEVTSIRDTGAGVTVATRDTAETFDLVVTCAGLQSDRVSRAAGDTVSPRVVPFFGDYVLLAPAKRALVRGLIYPVPDPRYPFLGVHLTKRIDGEVMLGPNAFLSPGREAYSWRHASLRDTAETLAFPGFWKFAARNVPAAIREAQTVLSKRLFVRAAARYVPGLRLADVVPGGRGIRAQAMDDDGGLLDDFAIAASGRLTCVRNAPSPGATSSLAIAEHVVAGVLDRLGIPATG